MPTSRWIYNLLIRGLEKNGDKYEKLPEGKERDALLKNQEFILNLIPKNCPRSLIQSGGGGMIQMKLAHAMNALANGQYFKAIGYLMKKERKIPLPCEETPEKTHK